MKEVFFLVGVAAAAIALTCLTVPANEERATDYLDERGYTDIDTEIAITGFCAKGNTIVKYEATNADGQREEGKLCAGIWVTRSLGSQKVIG